MATVTSSDIYALDFNNGQKNRTDWVVLSDRVTIRLGPSAYVAVLSFKLDSPATSITVSYCNGSSASSTGNRIYYKLLSASEYNNGAGGVPYQTFFKDSEDGSFLNTGVGYARQTFTINKAVPAGWCYLYMCSETRLDIHFYNDSTRLVTIDYVAGQQQKLLPVYINVDGTIKQVEKIFINVDGAIKECTVYTNQNGSIKEIT